MHRSIHLVLKPAEEDGELEQTILRMDEECFPNTYRVSTKDTWWWLATVDGTNAGYAGMKYLKLDRCGYFSRAGVLQKFRRKGLHKKLITSRITYAKRSGWEGVLTYVAKDNEDSINALVGRGFRLYTPHYPWVGRDEFIYLRLLF